MFTSASNSAELKAVLCDHDYEHNKLSEVFPAAATVDFPFLSQVKVSNVMVSTQQRSQLSCLSEASMYLFRYSPKSLFFSTFHLEEMIEDSLVLPHSFSFSHAVSDNKNKLSRSDFKI